MLKKDTVLRHCVVVAPLLSIRRGEFRQPSKRKWSVCIRGHFLGVCVITGSALWQSDSNNTDSCTNTALWSVQLVVLQSDCQTPPVHSNCSSRDPGFWLMHRTRQWPHPETRQWPHHPTLKTGAGRRSTQLEQRCRSYHLLKKSHCPSLPSHFFSVQVGGQRT